MGFNSGFKGLMIINTVLPLFQKLVCFPAKELEIVEVPLTENGANLQTAAAVAAITEQKDN